MLKSLHLREVGPAPKLDAEFGERLNVFTGDNGLGKTFLLDVAWWVLTNTWAGEEAMVRRDRRKGEPALIAYDAATDTNDGRGPVEVRFNFRTQHWSDPWDDRLPAALVVYARVDGSFSLWDPARHNYPGTTRRTLPPGADQPVAYHFSPKDIWWGLAGNGDGKVVCNGLIRDWVNWQNRSRIPRLAERPPFETLARVIRHLSPDEDEQIEIGEPMRVSLDSALEIPTLRLPYDIVPVTVASAGMRRITALAYLLVWAWHEHCLAAKLRNEAPQKRMLLLMDEVEAHLHPKWQRSILPAVVNVADALKAELSLQVIATTHAPLVLASIETLFDEERDRLFSFEHPAGSETIVLEQLPWAKQGDAVNWLVSDAFGLRQARSKEAEQAIEAAQAFMRGDLDNLPTRLNTKQRIHKELRRVLAGHDPFWPRWIVKTEKSRA